MTPEFWRAIERDFTQGRYQGVLESLRPLIILTPPSLQAFKVFGAAAIAAGDVPALGWALSQRDRLDEAAARAAGFDPVVKVNDLRDWRSAKTYAEAVAFAKVLIDPETDLVLGAHLAGHGAEEVIHLFTLAMKTGMTASELATMTYAYPTFSSDLKFLV